MEGEQPKVLSAAKFERIKELLLDAIYHDGEHHKQWYLVQVATMLGIELEEDTDQGVPL